MTEQQPVDALGHTLSAEFLHDLRTPLNQILGYSELLIEQAVDEGQTGFVPDLQKIHAAGRQLLALLTQSMPPLPEMLSQAADPMPAPELRTGAAFEQPTPAAVQSAILVVDDSRTNRDMLSRRLERQGYGVATAESGSQALQQMRAQEFDLVLLDIMMPEMDGFAVLQQLKADDALRHIPVIMISALDELESVGRCIEMGAADYLPKPSDPTLFKARIGAILERKHARDRERRLCHELQLSHRRLEELEKLRDDLMHKTNGLPDSRNKAAPASSRSR
ncbi:MAG: putative histidine kinase [Chthonomonadaceae bacterium]|nr:putative histidine kinase [Chthonomonadaceae bacterium]